jgi:hypothetical protein
LLVLLLLLLLLMVLVLQLQLLLLLASDIGAPARGRLRWDLGRERGLVCVRRPLVSALAAAFVAFPRALRPAPFVLGHVITRIAAFQALPAGGAAAVAFELTR